MENRTAHTGAQNENPGLPFFAETAAGDYDDKFKYFFDNSVVGSSITLISGELQVNSAMCRMLGYSAEELAGKKWQDVSYPDDIERTQAEISALLNREKESVHFDKRYIRKDGTILWADVYTSVRRNAEGMPLYFVTSVIDIDEKRKAEDALNESQKTLTTQNELMRSLLTLLPMGVFMVDSFNGTPIIANEAALRLLGRGILPDTNSHNLSEVYKARRKNEYTPYPPEDMPIVKGMQGIISRVDDMIIELPDGTERNLEVFGSPVLDGEGRTWASLVTFMDITERIRAYDDLDEAHKFNEDIIHSANEGIIVYDLELRYKLWNPYMERLTGAKSQQLIGQRAVDIFPQITKNGLLNMLENTLITQKASEHEVRFDHSERNGVTGWARNNISPLYNSKNEMIGILSIVQNITEHKKSEEKLMYLSYHDQLTGLYNRRFFEEELMRLDTERNIPLTIVMADVNGLKLFNDSFGHKAGDELLKKVAGVIRQGCRADDIAARLGGDEFVIILPGTTLSQAEGIIDRFEALISQEEVESVSLSVSFGYETKKFRDEDIHEVFSRAENHMYRHKVNENTSIRSKTIQIVMNTLFEKSTREMLHSKRVSELCEAIATELGLDNDTIRQVKTAGLVHDIGKIGIDESILNKSGRLTNIEWDEIKRHPESGWRILISANEFSELADFVLEHHERWDGSGYPKGLKGNEISLEARIISIDDSYDAMTSDRPYQKGAGKEEAIEEITRCSGTQFDPDIARIFIENVLSKTDFQSVLKPAVN